jgi:glycosyltransferase involved in cell wall biosynthesis
VVPTYNNADNNRHISNIRSIVMQNYHNYRIVVINDASTDQSAQEILSYLQMQSKVKSSNFIFTNNSENQGSSRNIRRAAFENCEPN